MSPETQQKIKDFAELAHSAGWRWCGVQEAIAPALPSLVIEKWGVTKQIRFTPTSFDPVQVAASLFHSLEKKMPLKEKLYEIYKALDVIEKAGHNQSQHYDYIKASDVTRAIRSQFIEQKIYAEINFDFVGSPYTIARAKDPNAPFAAVNVKCSIVFHDLDSEVTLTASGLGTGADTSDKAVYKAMTGALKYALKNAVLAPDEADPEADESVDERGGSRQVSEIPDFQDAKRAPAPRQDRPASRPAPPPVPKAAEENPFDSQPAKAAKTAPPVPPVQATAPEEFHAEVEAERGDAYEGPDTEDNRLPTEDELNGYRKLFTEFSNNMADKGKLKPSKGLPAATKLKAFLLNITQADSPKELTKAQWDNFFERVKAASARENGFVDLAKLINKVNGIEDKK